LIFFLKKLVSLSQARHTGIKITQQIAILMGCAILPHLKNLVETIEAGLEDEQQKVGFSSSKSFFFTAAH